jgi:hypothetical protein
MDGRELKVGFGEGVAVEVEEAIASLADQAFVWAFATNSTRAAFESSSPTANQDRMSNKSRTAGIARRADFVMRPPQREQRYEPIRVYSKPKVRQIKTQLDELEHPCYDVVHTPKRG